MHKNVVLGSPIVIASFLGLTVSAGLVACSSDSTSPPQTTPAASTAAPADTAHIAKLNAREQALAKREADLAAKEAEQERARQEAAEAQQQREALAKSAAAKKAALAKSTPVKRSTVEAAHPGPVKAAAAPPIEVPAGTPLTVALASDLSSKTAMRGDAFEAHLVSDLMINDRRIASAGARVTGTIVDVVSGSKAIGAIPMLSLALDHLELSNGERIAISGELVQQGKSEKVRDTAKILGGAAAGAIVGRQVKHNDAGTIIGGLLGGAAGAVAAKKTGTEVEFAAGSPLTIILGEAFKVAST